MKIANPFYQYEHVRWVASKGEKTLTIGMVGQFCYEIDIPEEADVCLLECVNAGRSDADKVYSSRVWSKEHGLMGVGDWATKCRLEAEKAELKVEQEKAAKRKAKEARERGKQQRVIEEKRTPTTPEIEDKPLSMGDDLKL